MVNESDIKYAESEVRRLEGDFANKKNSTNPDLKALAELEMLLKAKQQNLRDLQSRKRHNDDQKRRDDEQTARDDRRKRLS